MDFIKSLGAKFSIDEAQRNPEIAIAIKWAIDDKKAHCILIKTTGLNLLDKTYETLAGRIQTFYLPLACFGVNVGIPLLPTDYLSDYN